jgi:hypothetical protein
MDLNGCNLRARPAVQSAKARDYNQLAGDLTRLTIVRVAAIAAARPINDTLI